MELDRDLKKYIDDHVATTKVDEVIDHIRNELNRKYPYGPHANQELRLTYYFTHINYYFSVLNRINFKKMLNLFNGQRDYSKLLYVARSYPFKMPGELYDPIKHGNEHYANINAAAAAKSYNSAAAANAHFANIRESSSSMNVSNEPAAASAATSAVAVPVPSKSKTTRKAAIVPARMTQKEFAELNPFNEKWGDLYGVERESTIEYLKRMKKLGDEDAIDEVRRRANRGNVDANAALRNQKLRGGRSRRRSKRATRRRA